MSSWTGDKLAMLAGDLSKMQLYCNILQQLFPTPLPWNDWRKLLQNITVNSYFGRAAQVPHPIFST
jgi:hypothetical protein